MKKLHHFNLYIILVLIFTWSPEVFSEQVRYYDIDLVIFESTDAYSRKQEIWKPNTQIDVPDVFVELGKPYPGPIPKEFNPKFTFKQLPTRNSDLQGSVKLLSGSHNYNVLLHIAWRQPGMEQNEALPVHIHQEYISKPAEAPVKTGELTTPDQKQPTRSILDGYVKIILSRYLHANVDLTYTTNLPYTTNSQNYLNDMDSNNSNPVIYHLSQSRKMRSNELHYLDHPVLGVLIKAIPYPEK